MEERHIPEFRIVETINHPDFTRQTHNGREERYKKFSRAYLMVIVRREPTTLIVITMHWVGKLPK